VLRVEVSGSRFFNLITINTVTDSMAITVTNSIAIIVTDSITRRIDKRADITN